ncbi:hypothetical protein GCM10023189_22590 [Nibrella saemangeumensis]|uniref:Alpha-amylase n=1 Tax=Nibrella saemangeumensis TaxID=1084526 RepID=A0ABP8MRY9_9BACT
MHNRVYAFFLLFFFWSLSQLTYAQQVMLQGWYWDYPKTGQGYNWSDTLRLKAPSLGQAGFTHVWYPPFAGNGNKSGGYDPKDLFVGTEQTSLGTLGEIKTMVSSLTAVGITPVADMVYNHRDAGAPESNPAVKDYITKFASGTGSYGFKRPFPSDRYRMIIPIGGNRAEGTGTYYIKMRSRGSIFNGAKYAFHVTTNKIGGSRWSPVITPDVDLTNLADQEKYAGIQLGRNYLNKINSNGDIDEFAVTVTASDFNALGDSLIIQAINYDSEYSDHLPIDIYYEKVPGAGSYNIADYTNPFLDGYKLVFQTYTDFTKMTSKRGGLNWNAFRPHFDGNSPAGWSQTTSLGPEWSMQSMDYFYDYDHNVPATRDTLIAWTKWAYDELGSKGLRMDAIKHFEPSFVSKMLNEMVASNRTPNLVVGEWYGENTDELKGWVDAVSSGLNEQTRQAAPVKVFDFSLRRALKEALDNGANVRQVYFSSLRDAKNMSGFNVVTFLNNHDFRSANTSHGDALVHNNPILGYAYLLTNNQLGVPAVFYPDYYGYPARNSKFGSDTYGFDYHPVGLKPMKAEIDQLMKVLKTYINNSPGVHYLNHYGGVNNSPPSPNNYIKGSHNRTLIYQLEAPTSTGKDVIVAINFGEDTLKVDHLIAVRNGITQGTQFADILGKSKFPYAVVDGQNRIYVELPPKSYSVWVQDVAPLSATLAVAPVSGTICPGQSATLTTTTTGGTAPYTYAFSTGATPTQSSSVATATTSGPYSVTVTDALGLTAVASVTLTVKEATTITQEPASASVVCAGTPVSVPVMATGPGTLGYQWYRTGTNAPVAGQNTSTLSIDAAKTTDTDGYYCVVTSSCTSLTSTTFNLTVNSLPTVATAGPLSPQLIGTPVSLTATLSGDLAGATWQWQWGNGATTGGVLTNNTLVTEYTYAGQGVFSPTLVITSACSQTVAATHQYVVIYNPDGGFVTGGGWIQSSAGAYKEDLALAGRATFGFVAKYKRGSTVPDGNTEFQFKAGNLNFKSIAYEDMRLVIAGSRANYKGTGTINGKGTYSFLVSAIDGQVSGGGGTDKFRIKIWTLNSDTGQEQIVYDNNLSELNQAENADPETAIGGGSIVIHSEKSKREAAEPVLSADALVLRNYPNPVEGSTTIEFMLPQGGDYSLDIQDLKGSVVRHLQAGKAEAGLVYQVSWEAGKTPGGLYITRLTTGQGVTFLKLLVR